MRKHLKPTKQTRRFPQLTLTMVLIATAVLAITAVAAISRQKAGATGAVESEIRLPAAQESDFVTVKVAGQDVAVNSRTGQIKALTPDEARKLAAGLKRMVNQSTEGLVQVQHADGSVSMDLERRFQNVTVARVNKDGSVSQSCVNNPQAAGAFFGIDPKLIEGQSKTRAVVNQQSPKVEKQR